MQTLKHKFKTYTLNSLNNITRNSVIAENKSSGLFLGEGVILLDLK